MVSAKPNISTEQEFKGASERLAEMLNENIRWKDKEGKGLCKAISVLTEFSYATAQKWLHSNTLPRTANERQIVANLLGVDLLYWEYGLKTSRANNIAPEVYSAPITVMNFCTITLKKFHELGYTEAEISSDKLFKIQELIIEIAKKSNEDEPDLSIVEKLFLIART